MSNNDNDHHRTDENYEEHRLRWSAAEFDKFLERLTDENVELDTDRLRDVLHMFERTQLERQRRQQQLEKHRHDKQQHHLERQKLQFNSQPSSHAKQQTLLMMAAAPSTERRLQSDNFTNRSAETTSANNEGAIGNNTTNPTTQHQQPLYQPHPNHHHHHHVVGEQLGPGRLVHGPHGALIVEPVEQVQHERLDVNPIELKANHAGTMLSYDGHHHDLPTPILPTHHQQPLSLLSSSTASSVTHVTVATTTALLVAPSIAQPFQPVDQNDDV